MTRLDRVDRTGVMRNTWVIRLDMERLCPRSLSVH